MLIYDKDILNEIRTEIDGYIKSNHGKNPSYIIINENDTERLLIAMHKANLIPDLKPPKKFVLYNQRVIRTSDIPEGNFDVVGA